MTSMKAKLKLIAPYVVATLLLGFLVAWMVAFVRGEIQKTDAVIKASEDSWAGSHVVKICRDGTYIYRLKDGNYNAWRQGTGRPALVLNPETVCTP